MTRIVELDAWEVLDSRGLPTVRASCRLAGGATGSASVPSGRSRGTHEAAELRDGDPDRYRGLGCRKAVAGIKGEIAAALTHRDIVTQSDLDDPLIELDGTPDRSRLGANALLAVSLAYARAAAQAAGDPLWVAFARMADNPNPRLPAMMVNLFSGGMHAGDQVPIQDVLVVPDSRLPIYDRLAMTREVFATAAELAKKRYGYRLLTADEGGLAPPFPSTEAMLDDVIEAIQIAELDDCMSLAIDVAASHFHHGGMYRLGDETLDASGMVSRIATWVSDYPIISVEDGLDEDDWPAWTQLRARLAGRALTLGDDLLCTNPERIRRAVATSAADGLLLKVNQVGTLTEAVQALHLARDAGWEVVVSARSGETEDDWLADLAVGWSADYIKVGSITQSDRLAKYNRLLMIEARSNVPGTEL